MDATSAACSRGSARGGRPCSSSRLWRVSRRPQQRRRPRPPCAAWKNSARSTWAIVQDRHPFRDLTNESDLKHQLRRKLFILAENSYLEDLDSLQRSVLEAFARGVDY